MSPRSTVLALLVLALGACRSATPVAAPHERTESCGFARGVAERQSRDFECKQHPRASHMTATPSALSVRRVGCLDDDAAATIDIAMDPGVPFEWSTAIEGSDAFTLDAQPRSSVSCEPSRALLRVVVHATKAGRPGDTAEAVLHVRTTDPSLPTFDVPLRAETVGTLEISPARIDFGDAAVAAEVRRPIAITNHGSSALALATLPADLGPFSLESPLALPHASWAQNGAARFVPARAGQAATRVFVTPRSSPPSPCDVPVALDLVGTAHTP